MSVKIELSTPVMSEGAEIKSLEFREPIGEDIVACGYPVRIIMGSATDPDVAVGEQKYDVNVTVATKLAARLANVPPSTIKRLSLADYQATIGVIIGFFGQSEPEK